MNVSELENQNDDILQAEVCADAYWGWGEERQPIVSRVFVTMPCGFPKRGYMGHRNDHVVLLGGLSQMALEMVCRLVRQCLHSRLKSGLLTGSNVEVQLRRSVPNIVRQTYSEESPWPKYRLFNGGASSGRRRRPMCVALLDIRTGYEHHNRQRSEPVFAQTEVCPCVPSFVSWLVPFVVQLCWPLKNHRW